MVHLYNYSLLLLLCFAVFVFSLLFFISAPYGKFYRKGWGPTVKSKWAWLLMESPSPALMTYIFIVSGGINSPQTIFITLWLLHYTIRTFIYPFRQSGKDKAYPMVLVLMAGLVVIWPVASRNTGPLFSMTVVAFCVFRCPS